VQAARGGASGGGFSRLGWSLFPLLWLTRLLRLYTSTTLRDVHNRRARTKVGPMGRRSGVHTRSNEAAHACSKQHSRARRAAAHRLGRQVGIDALALHLFASDEATPPATSADGLRKESQFARGKSFFAAFPGSQRPTTPGGHALFAWLFGSDGANELIPVHVCGMPASLMSKAGFATSRAAMASAADASAVTSAPCS
jgi:hypothetical protein